MLLDVWNRVVFGVYTLFSSLLAISLLSVSTLLGRLLLIFLATSLLLSWLLTLLLLLVEELLKLVLLQVGCATPTADVGTRDLVDVLRST